MNMPKPSPDAPYLLEKDPVITPNHIDQASIISTQNKQPFLQNLEEVSGLESDEFTLALGSLIRYPVLTSLDLDEMQPDFTLVPFTEAGKLACVAVRDKDNTLYLVCADPFDAYLQNKLYLLISEPVIWALVHSTQLADYLVHHEANMRALTGEIGKDVEAASTVESGIEDISLHSISEESSPVVKFVRSTLYDALKAGASDIHMETDANGLNVKYRIDGVLSRASGIQDIKLAEQAVSRIKVMSELDISERRVPQDGRFKVLSLGHEVDFRVSIMPSVYGEDAVLRILDRQALSEEAQGLSLDVLGFEADIMARFRLLAEEPYGMLLVTGPTGSGKTTTLYGIISEINRGDDKIITIEDPVEYQLPGVLQIPVNEKKGLTFVRGLRSILRHDPDKIMVGEIRDNETAQIAVQSALTGHLVLTTIHANNVFDVIGRFTNMGVDSYSFVSAMNGILAQRLLRITCPHCAVEDKPDADLIAKSGLTSEQEEQFNFIKGMGCGQCHGSGYKGRKAIAELLCFNDEIRDLIMAREPVRKIKQAAYKNGTTSMRQAALELVKRGETTLQEANRVTSLV
ncbi:MAG: general secretion pathway protein GspE [Gammaproteobacteria bacterium]|nr:MAG: general secretion pathway protein GspE [Gammaproteobacteria bacterium]